MESCRVVDWTIETPKRTSWYLSLLPVLGSSNSDVAPNDVLSHGECESIDLEKSFARLSSKQNIIRDSVVIFCGVIILLVLLIGT